MPIVYTEDPIFFPNSYGILDKSYLLINNSSLKNIYKSFNISLELIDFEGLKNLGYFYLVGEIPNYPFHMKDFRITEIKDNIFQINGLKYSVYEFQFISEKKQ